MYYYNYNAYTIASYIQQPYIILLLILVLLLIVLLLIQAVSAITLLALATS